MPIVQDRIIRERKTTSQQQRNEEQPLQPKPTPGYMLSAQYSEEVARHEAIVERMVLRSRES